MKIFGPYNTCWAVGQIGERGYHDCSRDEDDLATLDELSRVVSTASQICPATRGQELPFRSHPFLVRYFPSSPLGDSGSNSVRLFTSVNNNIYT